MNSTPPVLSAPPSPVRVTRSWFVTALGWCLLVVSALFSLLSLTSLVLVLGTKNSTANSSLFEAFCLIGLPPLTLVAAFGLLRRWRWAHVYVLALLVGIAGWNVARMMRGPTPERTYTSPSGTRTTVMATEVNYPQHLALVVVSLGLAAMLLSKSARADFRDREPAATAGGPPVQLKTAATDVAAAGGAVASAPAGDSRDDRVRGWRVGHQGRDEMYYEEWRDGAWHRLRISGEMLIGRAHHVIYFDSPTVWLRHPEWARHRRDEIIGRIKSAFRPPDYEYQEDGVGAAAPAAGTVVPQSMQRPIPPPGAGAPAGRRHGPFAGVIALLVLFAISGVMGWLVVGGITNGETYLPAKFSRRKIVRAEGPALFWASVGVYAIVGTGAFGLGAWGLREAFRQRR